MAAREQQRAGRVLAEAGGEERALAHRLRHQILHFARGGEEQLHGRRLAGVGHAEDHAVVAPEDIGVDPPLAQERRLHRGGPGSVHARAERCEHADADVADVVVRPLDHDGAIARHRAGGLLLLVQVREQVARRLLVEAVLLLQPLHRARERLLHQLARELADPLAELDRPARAVAVPERHLPRHARRGAHQHLVVGDLLDAPGAGAEHEDVARAGLEDHLLVELADAPGAAAQLVAAGEEDAVEAAVGDGARVGDGHPRGAVAGPQLAPDAIPGDARAQLGELVARVAAREHLQHVLERAARQVGKRRRCPHQPEERLDADRPLAGDGDDLLRQHVERVAWIRRGLHRAVGHAGCCCSGREQIAPVLGKEHAARYAAHLVPRAPEPLQAARHARRRLDLQHQIDRAHVDAQLQRRGGDDALERAALEPVLHLLPLLARHRPVVRQRHLLARQLVERARQPLGEPPRVGEDHRRGVGADQLEQPRVQRGPDRAPPRPRRRAARRKLLQFADAREVVDQHLHGELELLLHAGIDDRHLARQPPLRLAVERAAAEQPRHLVERARRRREADPLQRPPLDSGTLSRPQRLQPFQREEEVGAALGGDQRMDLVDDDRIDGPQRLPRPRREQQEERLWCGDQDIWRMAQHLRPLARWSVAGPDPHRGQMAWNSKPLCGGRDARQRRA
jgi:hypothetical protein